MNRRDFLFKSLTASALVGTMGTQNLFASGSKIDEAIKNVDPNPKKFKIKFAPNIYSWTNLFPVSYKGMTIAEKMDFLGKLGFIAYEDNDFYRRKPEDQEIILNATKKYGMEFGVFTVPLKGKFVLTENKIGDSKKADKSAAMAHSAEAVENAAKLAKKIGAKWMTVVPGYLHEHLLDMDVFANVMDHLRPMAKICESYGVTMVLEPLCHVNHHGVWLKKTAQAYSLCKAVNSPSCKILFDVYHQQTDEGNLFRNIEKHFDQIAYFHLGDVPLRTEPLSGEINYHNLIKHIMGLGYTGILGMEHRLSDKSLEGERKLMRAYRSLDS